MQIIVPAKLHTSQYRFFRPVPQILNIHRYSPTVQTNPNQNHGTYQK